MKKRAVKKSSSMKKAEKISKKDSISLGISGFTLAIVGIVTILLNPLISAATLLVGLVFCIIQQRRNKTRMGKSGLILNILGLLLNIAWWLTLVYYIIPKLAMIS